jgi:hypothetical protein
LSIFALHTFFLTLKIQFKMRLTRFLQFTACVFIASTLSLISACSKDDVAGSTTTTSKCDYAPYSVGSKFTFVANGTQTATDTITGDTTINGVGYVKLLSSGPSTNGVASTSTNFVRCDASGVYTLIDKGQIGGVGVGSFTAKEIQSIKLPASVGQAWKSDTIKYTTTQGISVATVYKMTTTAVGGSKVANGTTYSNGLVTVQFKVFTATIIPGIPAIVDSSTITSNVFDKAVGYVEISQNGKVVKSLKTASIK